MKKFFFIHIPKTAGTSFREALEHSIPPGSMFCDYGPKSEKTSVSVRNSIYGEGGFQVYELFQAMDQFETSVLCGHVRAKKYIQGFGYEKMAVFLREPVARTISAYLANKRSSDFRGSLVDFCTVSRGINRQSQLLEGMDISKFGFVGITEYYNKSLADFTLFSGLTVENLKLNVAKNYPDFFTEEELEAVRQANQLDIQLYKEALAVFEARGGKLILNSESGF